MQHTQVGGRKRKQHELLKIRELRGDLKYKNIYLPKISRACPSTEKIMQHIKDILKDSIFGALFTLWTAPIDNHKLDISQVKSEKKKALWFLNNLIVSHKMGT